MLGGALVTSVASAIVGMRITRQAPEGETPAESGNGPAPQTPEAARSQRLSAFLGSATVALVAGVLGMSSALEVGLGRAPGGPAGRALFVPDGSPAGVSDGGLFETVPAEAVARGGWGLPERMWARRAVALAALAGLAGASAALLARTRHAEGLLRALRR